MAKIAKMAKFYEKSRFLWKKMAGYARKCVRKRLKNAVGMLRAVRIFQKVTAGVSPVKQSVRQNEMGDFGAKVTILLTPTKWFPDRLKPKFSKSFRD
jgi:hypothetical protein